MLVYQALSLANPAVLARELVEELKIKHNVS